MFTLNIEDHLGAALLSSNLIRRGLYLHLKKFYAMRN